MSKQIAQVICPQCGGTHMFCYVEGGHGKFESMICARCGKGLLRCRKDEPADETGETL